MARHLTGLPGGAANLPPGTLRPTPSGLGPRRPRQRPPQPSAPPALHDWATEIDDTVSIPLTPVAWSLIHSALVERGQGNSLRSGSLAHAELAVEVRQLVRARTLVTPRRPPAAPGPAEHIDSDPTLFEGVLRR